MLKITEECSGRKGEELTMDLDALAREGA